MDKKILVTAFDAFGGKGYNPSEKLLGMLTGEGVEKALLPTSFSRAPELLRGKAKAVSPAAIVCLGLASGRSAVSLEFAALNIKDSDKYADNDGELASGQSVIPGAPNALFTSLDLGRIVSKIRESGVPCRVSYHAGTYVCNCVYYHALSLGVPAVFIHIPDDETSAPSPDAPHLSLSGSAKAVSKAISEIETALG